MKEGYIGSIGLTQIPAQMLEKAVKVHSIHTVELEYSPADRRIEGNGILETAANHHVSVLAFGVLAHGLLSERAFANNAVGRPGLFTPDNIRMVSDLKGIADEKNTTIEKLAQAYIYAKHPDMSILIGTTGTDSAQSSWKRYAFYLCTDLRRSANITHWAVSDCRGSSVPCFLHHAGNERQLRYYDEWREETKKGGDSFYEAFDHFHAEHDVAENDEEIFYGSVFQEFNEQWQGKVKPFQSKNQK